MATSITIVKDDVGQDYISFHFKVNVTYAATYHIEYGVEGEGSRTSGTFTLPDGGSYTTKTAEFDGLYPSTTYTVWCSLWNNETDTELGIENELDITTDDAPLIATTYYAQIRLRGNGGSPSNVYSDVFAETTWDDYADIEVEFDGSSFEREGYELLGFSKSSSATSATYDVEDVCAVEATSEDENSPTTVTLYAVWSKDQIALWEWQSSIGGELELHQINDTEYACYPLTADEWNDFLARIYDVADVLGVPLFSWPNVQVEAISGQEMTMVQAQYAIACLESLNPDKPVPDGPTITSPYITATFINGLKESLNSVIKTL